MKTGITIGLPARASWPRDHSPGGARVVPASVLAAWMFDGRLCRLLSKRSAGTAPALDRSHGSFVELRAVRWLRPLRLVRSERSPRLRVLISVGADGQDLQLVTPRVDDEGRPFGRAVICTARMEVGEGELAEPAPALTEGEALPEGATRGFQGPSFRVLGASTLHSMKGLDVSVAPLGPLPADMPDLSAGSRPDARDLEALFQAAGVWRERAGLARGWPASADRIACRSVLEGEPVQVRVRPAPDGSLTMEEVAADGRCVLRVAGYRTAAAPMLAGVRELE